MNKAPTLTLKILGWLVAVTIIIGGIFKVQHWPGANVAILISAFVYFTLYMPLWFQQAWKEKGKRFFIVTQFLFTCLFVIWQIVNYLNWKGVNLVDSILFMIVILAIIPISLFKLAQQGRTSLYKFNNLVLIIFFISISQTYVKRISETNVGYNGFVLSANQVEASYKTIQSKSIYLYSTLNKLNNKTANPYYKKALLLKRLTDSTEEYINQFKINLITKLDNRVELNFDTIHISEIRDLADMEVPQKVIVGDNPESPSLGKYKGTELKSVVDVYRDSAVNYVTDDEKTFIISGTNLNTQDINVNGEKENWVTYNFAHVPGITALVTLTELQYEVKNLESVVLTNLLNNASKSGNDSTAYKIAELGYQLNKEKENEKIKDLEKESEVAKLSLSTKKYEIEAAYTTIAWFGIAIALFIVITFYIVRSNIVRKKLLAQAKANLADYVTNMEGKSRLLEEFRVEVEKLKSTANEQRITKLESLNQASILTDGDWNQFRLLFEQVYPGFLVRLKDKLNELTPGEIRLICLTKLKFGTKQMAGILGVSDDTIRKTRYRLRKKLGLAEENTLDDVVNSI